VLLDRLALHAHRLELHHPATGAPLVLESPVPADLAAALAALRRLQPAASVSATA
jgi:23S rRNA pseudouridine955/2504/2580 synthase